MSICNAEKKKIKKAIEEGRVRLICQDPDGITFNEYLIEYIDDEHKRGQLHFWDVEGECTDSVYWEDIVHWEIVKEN